MAQWYCMIDGSRYGPVETDGLEQWVRENRVKGADLVWCEGMTEWQEARNVPALRSVMSASSPLDDLISHSQPPPIPTAGGSPPLQSGLKPHRGGTVLALGIIGLACCWICGIVAWVMGNADMKEMDDRLMDASGRGLTQAGRICGIISVILAIVGIVFYGLFFAIGLAGNLR